MKFPSMKFSLLITCRSKDRNAEVAQVLRDIADRVERDELALPTDHKNVDYYIVRGNNGHEIGRAAYIAEPNRLRQRH